MSEIRNVLGEKLQPCCRDSLAGFYRDGHCLTGTEDPGTHVVCAQVTKEFLEFTKSRGNDLITPRPLHRFRGLKPGDKWCLCVLRWKEACDAGVAPLVILASTNKRALDFVSLEELKAHALETTPTIEKPKD